MSQSSDPNDDKRVEPREPIPRTEAPAAKAEPKGEESKAHASEYVEGAPHHPIEKLE